MSNKCPVCEKEMKAEVYYMDLGLPGTGGPVEEEYLTCPEGHYSCVYSYGATNIYVGDDEEPVAGWYCNDPDSKIKREEKEAAKAVSELREKLGIQERE